MEGRQGLGGGRRAVHPGDGLRDPQLFGAGAVVTLSIAALTLIVGYKVLKIPTGLLMGILSGIQTNPGVLAYAQQEAKNDLPAIGYATVYPMATIAKIILAQLILVTLK